MNELQCDGFVWQVFLHLGVLFELLFSLGVSVKGRKIVDYDRNGQGHENETTQGTHATDDVAERRNGHNVSVAKGCHSHNGPPKANEHTVELVIVLFDNLLGVEYKTRKQHDRHEQHHHVENQLANAVAQREYKHTQATVLGHEREYSQYSEYIKHLDVIVHLHAPAVFVVERFGWPKQRKYRQKFQKIVRIFQISYAIGRRHQFEYVLDEKKYVTRKLDVG